TQIAKGVVLQVSQNTIQNFSLKVAQTNIVVTVESTQPVIDATTITVGQVIDQNVVQDIPLNGRHFVDLALLVPGTVTPPSNWFDARNFFNPQFTSTGAPNPQSALKRNQFGGDFGSPIKHGKTYFFLSYEGLRHRQGLTTTSPVLSDAQRTQIRSSGSPSAQGLLSLIPPSNGLIGTTPAFFGSATAPVNINQGSADIGHNLSESDHLHGYYIYQ